MTDPYEYLPIEDLRALCNFKDGTIEILQRALTNARTALDSIPKPVALPWCEVYLGESSYHPYTYLTGGLYLKPGDKVIVPVGPSHTLRSATVVSVHNIEPLSSSIMYKTVYRKDEDNA